MAKKDHEQPDDGDEVLGEEGSEAQVSDPDPQEDADELTVEDILGAPGFDTPPGGGYSTTESDEAAVADAPEQEHDLLLDLKRLQAEYANYRRRTEEQRELEIERAKGSVARGLLPVLDDLDRAEKHGDLVDGSPLLAIAEKLRGVVAKLGVESYAAAGDAFDPQQHEAIFQAPTPGVETPVILEVVEIGYRLGGIELRPAKVVVAVPAE